MTRTFFDAARQYYSSSSEDEDEDERDDKNKAKEEETRRRDAFHVLWPGKGEATSTVSSSSSTANASAAQSKRSFGTGTNLVSCAQSASRKSHIPKARLSSANKATPTDRKIAIEQLFAKAAAQLRKAINSSPRHQNVRRQQAREALERLSCDPDAVEKAHRALAIIEAGVGSSLMVVGRGETFPKTDGPFLMPFHSNDKRHC